MDGSGRTHHERARRAAVVFVVTFAGMLLAGIAGLGVLSGVIMVLGWFLIAPLLVILDPDLPLLDDEPAADPEPDPVEALKRRYARGEIDEETFERRLDPLLTTDGESSDSTRERLEELE